MIRARKAFSSSPSSSQARMTSTAVRSTAATARMMPEDRHRIVSTRSRTPTSSSINRDGSMPSCSCNRRRYRRY